MGNNNMIMEKKSLIFVIFLSLGMTSCHFLDLEPKDFYTTEQFYENDSQVEQAMTSIYRTFIKIMSDYGQQFNGNSDEAYVYNAPDNSLQNFTHDATNKQVLNFWNNLYSGIKNINFMLDGIEKNKENLTEKVYLHAKGESLFLRGYFNFLLVQWYCCNEEGYGLPMPLDIMSSYEDTRMPIVPMATIYEQIEKDMTDAIPFLEDQTFASLGYSERVTIDAVYGILSRVCLYAAGFPNEGGNKGKEYYYNEAIKYGLKVKELGHELLSNYCDIFKDECKDKYNNETIWEVGYKYNGLGSDNVDSNISGWVGSAFGIRRDANDRNTGGQIFDSLLVTGSYRFVHPRLYVSYGDGDERRDWNCPQFSYTANTLVKVPKRLSTSDFLEGQTGILPESKVWGISIGKWRREDEPRMERDRSSNSTNFPLLRYSDVLLMIAEAYIELDQSAMAVSFINEVRNRAIDNPGADIVLDRIADDGSNVSGYTFVPKATINHGSGSGLEILVGHNTDSYGNVSITVLNPGTGYTIPPVITIEPKRVTWEANKKVLKNDYYLADNMCVYKVFEDGMTKGVSPDNRVSDWAKEKESSKEAERQKCGVLMNYVSGPISSLDAPTFSVVTGKAQYADVSRLVNVNNQMEMRQFLRDERRRELCFEGLRTMDLKRWGILVSAIKDVAKDLNGTTKGIPEYSNLADGPAMSINSSANSITEYNNYLPIPQTQLALNPNLKQNQGF